MAESVESKRSAADNNGSHEQSLATIYEEMFENRYTEADPAHLAGKSNVNSSPPCIFPWYSRPKRNFDYTQYPQKRNWEQQDNRGDRRDDGRNDKRRRYDEDDRGYNRNRGGGQNYNRDYHHHR